jgi:hypothetical protein
LPNIAEYPITQIVNIIYSLENSNFKIDFVTLKCYINYKLGFILTNKDLNLFEVEISTFVATLIMQNNKEINLG